MTAVATVVMSVLLVGVAGLAGGVGLGAVAAPPAAAQEPPPAGGGGAGVGATTPTVTRDVAYGTSGGRPLLLDVYAPGPGAPSAGAGGRPAVLLIHGGGWLAGSKAAVEPEGMALAEQGFVAFGVEYDMATLPHWPTELENVQTALRWVQDHATEHGVDRRRIGAFGGSAGGNLAMLLGTDGPGDDGYEPVRAVVSWSGPADLRTLAITVLPQTQISESATIPDSARPVACDDDPNCFAMLVPGLLVEYLSCSYNRCPLTYTAASPAAKVSASTPPMYLAGSQQDFVPMDQNFLMANALDEHGVRSVLQYVPGDRHADAYLDVALQPSIDFLATELAPGADPHVPPRSPPTTIAGSSALPPLEDGWRLPAPSVPPPWILVAIVTAVVLFLALVAVDVRRRVRRRRRSGSVLASSRA